jgi:antitoxin (DNA-binding transcriptional repressor) of toxin-antitoxin stability system
MRRLTATDAARRFSGLLDAVERRGETFIVERRGRAVASISPAPAMSGRTLKDVLQSHTADHQWSDELRELRNVLAAEERHWNG